VFPHGPQAQQDKVAALKQSLAANQKLQQQYKWVETTVVSMKGEEKSRTQKQCFYGPDGKVQKQPLSAPPPKAAPGGLKGKVIEKKKAELTATMTQAVELVHQYVPPDPQRFQATKAAGRLAITPTGPNSARLDLRDYAKAGDTLSLGLDTAGNALQTISVTSYLAAPSDAVTLDVTFARLREGLSYPGNVVLNLPGQQLQVVVQNSNYQKVAAAPAGAPASGGASAAEMDTLTAPIALYPDALIAQILQASTDVAAVQKFSAWLGANASLKGTPLQDAAQAAGFAACYVALAPFGQVVQMLAQKPDWTAQLGKAFVADKSAVFDSIQRLRAAAQALGNLKTTEQQAVVTETTSTGQSVIVIQPANPQVVYVPVYNTQTVYVQAPPPSSASVAGAAVVGFTAGIIIGAASDHYYHGPYGWHGAAMYDEAWDRREDYWDDRQDFAEDRYENRQDYAQDRQSNAQANQQQRQSTAQSNQSQRQATAQTNQANRQSAASSGTAQANQAQRQSAAQSNQATRQASAATSSAGSGQKASARSSGGGGLSGYQSGGSARAQSARGSSSRSASRGGGGRRR
jgi:hypothetical protein